MAKELRPTWLFVGDMARAIDLVRRIGLPESRSDPQEAALARLALERALEIISEASRHLPREAKAEYPDIPWQRIADFGNVLRHAYFGLEAERVDKIAMSDIPPLADVVRELQRKFPAPE